MKPKPAPKTKVTREHSTSVVMLADFSANILEIELLRRAIRKTDDNILRILNDLDGMRAKQWNRQKELARMKYANEQ